MPRPLDRNHLSGSRPSHPMRASIILVSAVAVLIVVLAVASTLQ